MSPPAKHGGSLYRCGQRRRQLPVCHLHPRRTFTGSPGQVLQGQGYLRGGALSRDQEYFPPLEAPCLDLSLPRALVLWGISWVSNLQRAVGEGRTWKPPSVFLQCLTVPLRPQISLVAIREPLPLSLHGWILPPRNSFSQPGTPIFIQSPAAAPASPCPLSPSKTDPAAQHTAALR